MDLIFTNSPELAIVEKADILLIPQLISDPAHTQMVCTIDCEPNISKSTDYASHYCFRKADYDKIRDRLDSFNFVDILMSNELNEMVDDFYKVLYSVIDEFDPSNWQMIQKATRRDFGSL